MLWNRLFALFQYLIPHHALTMLIGRLARATKPRWLKDFAIRTFISIYKVDISQAMDENPNHYASFNDFFTRHLKPDARPIASDPLSVLCPVDGSVQQMGLIRADRLFQAKGIDYTLESLLGNEPDRAKPFKNGHFATLYLAPKDYHRVHMPIDGQLEEMTYVPGRLFSVNPNTANHIPGLFARNERVVAHFTTPLGPMAMVLIGAMIVGSMETVWEKNIRPRARHKIRTWHYPSQGPDVITLKKGEEMGLFKLGSTVIVLFGPEKVAWEKNLTADSIVQMNQSLGAHLPQSQTQDA